MTQSQFSPDDNSRLRTLLSYGLLDSKPEDAFDRLVALAALSFDAPVAALALIAKNTYCVRSAIGLPARDMPRDPALEPPGFLDNALLWEADSVTTPKPYPALDADRGFPFVASSPILCPRGQVIGRLLVADDTPRPRRRSTREEALLSHLGLLATHHIALRQGSRGTKGDRSEAGAASEMRLFDESPVPLWVMERGTWRFTSVNQATTEKMGWSRDDFQAMSLGDILEGSMATAMAGSSSPAPSGAVRLRTKDGRQLAVDLQCRSLTGTDGHRVIAAALDLTERRMVEAALTNSRDALRRVLLQRTTTLDALPVDVALLDEAGRIMFVNRNWRNFATAGHFPEADTMIGGNYIEICTQNPYLYGGQGADVAAGVKAVLGNRSPAYEVEVPSPTAAGARWFKIMITPVRAATGLDGAVVLHIDITEAKRAAEAIQAADQLKSQFLANTSHELRTPLNAVIGFSELIKLQAFGEIDDKYLEYVDYIHSSGHHLLDIINDLLDLSKIEAGQMSLNEDAVKLADLAEECFDFLNLRMETGKLSHSVEIAPTIGVLCDRLRMKQILLNLLTNAVKFTPEGGHVTARALIDRDGRIILEIIDTGIGMDEEGARLALEPFVQIDSPAVPRQEGTGLGLALVKRLTELHGGTLQIHSALGIGTTVRVALPAERNLNRPTG